MMQEEKQLLLKDLSARLPYGVKVWRQGANYVVSCIDIEKQRIYLKADFDAIRGWWTDIEEVKPYLRQMSSMTEEEDKDWQFYKGKIANSCDELLEERVTELHNWFNLHQFDYHGLIKKGLALEVPETRTKQNNMKTKNKKKNNNPCIKHKLWGKLKEEAKLSYKIFPSERSNYWIIKYYSDYYRMYSCPEGLVEGYYYETVEEAQAELEELRSDKFYELCEKALYRKKCKRVENL